MGILIINVTKSIKKSKSKQLTGYIFVCCTVLAPSSLVLDGFAVQSEVLGNTVVLITSSGSYANTWVGDPEGSTIS